MVGSQARSLDEILQRAAELGPHERLSYLKSACGGDSVLLEALQRISGSFLAQDPADDESAGHAERQAGEQIGPYRIIRTLGRGGMGEVYLCERADEQFNKQVAIKLVSRGMVSRQVQTRLRTERQILATLDHPNIARLLDGGTTPEGVPFLVMEYVDGEPIDTYCDERQLTIGERLQLFRTVCSAVHAAHQNLIVHRDLKPSNILVTADGTPKLLDFGIAKLLDVRQTSHTVAMTHADIRVMTPDHASPEQVRGDPITTASDVYVLGVLLYELLAGQRPFDVAGLRFVDIERVICEQQPPPPSEALAASRVGKDAGARIARNRKTTVSRLRRNLAGELDNIVMMAMRKEADRRYASVEQFSADVDLYLRGMPLLARRDTWGYRTRKFVTRHTLAVSAAAAFLALLAGFAVTTYVQSHRIAQERDVAQAQRARAERVASFLVDLFRRADPTVAQGQNITAKEILERGARKIEVELAGEPETQAQLMDAIGRVYLGLGEEDTALPLLQRAVSLREQLYGASSPVTALSLQSLGEAELVQGDLENAERHLRQALNTQIATQGEEHESVTAALHSLALLLRSKGDFDASEKMLEQCLQRYVATLGERDSRTTSVMNELAWLLLTRGDYAGAERLYRSALTVDRELLGANHPYVAMQQVSLATALFRQGRLGEAEPLFRESIPTLRRVLGPEPQDTIAAISSYGRLLWRKGDLEGAETALREAVELGTRARGAGHYSVGYHMVGLAAVLYDRGQARDAEAMYEQALRIFRQTLPADHQYVASALTGLARIYADAGNAARVQELVDRATAIWNKEFPADHWQIANTRSWLGKCLLQNRQYEQAEGILLTSYGQLANQQGPEHELTRRVRDWLVTLYEAWGKPAEADRYRERVPAPAAPTPAVAAG